MVMVVVVGILLPPLLQLGMADGETGGSMSVRLGDKIPFRSGGAFHLVFGLHA